MTWLPYCTPRLPSPLNLYAGVRGSRVVVIGIRAWLWLVASFGAAVADEDDDGGEHDARGFTVLE